MLISAVLFLGLSNLLVSAQSLCEDYVSCMEKLESKQADCIHLEQNSKTRATDSCSRKKWQIKLELNGLHMRRAELARDCIQKNIAEGRLSEGSVEGSQRTTCDSLHRKFAFAPRVPARRKKRSISRQKRASRRHTKLYDCRNAARSWHKQCAALAKCCPLTEDCKLNTKDIMEQIYAERRKLRELKEQCEGR